MSMRIQIYLNNIGRGLERMESEYSLVQHLQQNGCTTEEIAFIQEQTRKYWTQTYGLLRWKFRIIHKDLILMHDLLEKQLERLQEIDHESYLKALRTDKEIQNMFNQEYVAFWQLVEHAKITDEQVGGIWNSMLVEKDKLQTLVRIYLTAIQQEARENVFEKETRLKQAIAVLSYLVGAAILCYRIKLILAESVAGKVLSWLRSDVKQQQKLQLISDKLKNVNNAFGQDTLKDLMLAFA